MLNDVVRQVVTMTGATGTAIPDMNIITQKAEKINYVTFANMTSNLVTIYPRTTDQNSLTGVTPLLKLGVFGSITFPFTDELKNGFLVAWVNAESGTDAIPKGLSIFYSETNIILNTSQAPGFASSLPAANVTIVGDTVGLAEAAQLPAALTAAGNLKIAVSEIAAFLSSTWTRVANNVAGAAVTLTEAAVGGVTHYCTGYNVDVRSINLTSETAIELKSGATVLHRCYLAQGATPDNRHEFTFPFPIKGSIGAAMTLEISAPGGATLLAANMTGFSV